MRSNMVSLYIFINFLYKLSLDFFEVEVDDDSFIFLSFLSFLLFVNFFLSSFLLFSLFIFFSFFSSSLLLIKLKFTPGLINSFSNSNVLLINFSSSSFDLNLSLFCNNDSLSYCIEILSKLYILKSLENSLYNSSFLFSLKI